MSCSERKEPVKNAPTHTSRPGRRSSYCGEPIGEVENVFCSATNVDGTFGPAFAAPRFFDARGAPIEIRGDLQERLDLDPALGCP